MIFGVCEKLETLKFVEIYKLCGSLVALVEQREMVMARRLLRIVAASAISVTAATSYTGTAPYSLTWTPPLASSNLRFSDTGVIGDVFSAGQGFVRSSRAVYTVSYSTFNVGHVLFSYKAFSHGSWFRV